MNPRIQVEHTVTEVVTGIDLVKSQILVAQGHKLHEAPLNIPPQDKIDTRGYAIQCRITTEDPENNFIPDYGRLDDVSLAAAVSRVRLDGGNGVRRRGHHAVLRFAAGESDDLRARRSRKRSAGWIARCANFAFAA